MVGGGGCGVCTTLSKNWPQPVLVLLRLPGHPRAAIVARNINTTNCASNCVRMNMRIIIIRLHQGSTKEEHKFFLHTRMEGIYGTGHKYGHFTKETPADASGAAAFSVAPNKTCTSSCAGHHHPYSTAPPLSLFSLSCCCCSSSYPFTSSKFYSLLEELRPEGKHWQKTQITVANPLEQNYWTETGAPLHRVLPGPFWRTHK